MCVQLPTIIADNGGYDSADLVAKLRAAHTDGKASHGLGKIISLFLCQPYVNYLHLLHTSVPAGDHRKTAFSLVEQFVLYGRG